MSDVTIRFWDKEKEEHVNDPENVYFTNTDGLVVKHIGLGEVRRCSHIEPHFFVNGERIA